MGYCIRVKNVKFRVKAVNKSPALQAIRGLQGKETIKDSSGPHFSWVDMGEFLAAGTLEDMLKEWRWHPTTDIAGDIVKIEFTGEKYGDDKLLFTAMASFVEAGSSIEFFGEDGAAWKYIFDGKTMKEVKGKTTFMWE